MSFGKFVLLRRGMTTHELTPEEKKIAYRLWEMSSDYSCCSVERARAFSEAPESVCEAIDGATQQPQYRHDLCRNPFGH